MGTEEAFNWVFSLENPDLKALAKKNPVDFKVWKWRNKQKRGKLLSIENKERILLKLGYTQKKPAIQAQWNIKLKNKKK